jgi:hypothetical protein
MANGISRASELYKHKGRKGRLGVGKTKFFEDFVFDPDRPDDQLIPGTDVPRLKPVALGEKAVGFLDDEVEAVIEGFRRERDRRPRTASRTGGGDA